MGDEIRIFAQEIYRALVSHCKLIPTTNYIDCNNNCSAEPTSNLRGAFVLLWSLLSALFLVFQANHRLSLALIANAIKVMVAILPFEQMELRVAEK